MLAHRLKKSRQAFAILTITGLSLLFTSASAIVAGCFLIYHENFRDSSGLKDKVQIEFDYSHYWLGGSYIVTAILTLSSACCQNRRRLTFVTTVFLITAMTLSLFAIVLDGPDWLEWKNADRTIKFWQNKEDYSCSSMNKTCSCFQDDTKLHHVTVSDIANCDDIVYLSAIYGAIVGGAVIGFGLCVATLLVMINSLSWKNPWKAFSSYTASYENKAAVSSLNDIMSFYREQPTRHPTLDSSPTLSIEQRNQEYMPAWSLYGSTAENVHITET